MPYSESIDFSEMLIEKCLFIAKIFSSWWTMHACIIEYFLLSKCDLPSVNSQKSRNMLQHRATWQPRRPRSAAIRAHGQFMVLMASAHIFLCRRLVRRLSISLLTPTLPTARVCVSELPSRYHTSGAQHRAAYTSRLGWRQSFRWCGRRVVSKERPRFVGADPNWVWLGQVSNLIELMPAKRPNFIKILVLFLSANHRISRNKEKAVAQPKSKAVKKVHQPAPVA